MPVAAHLGAAVVAGVILLREPELREVFKTPGRRLLLLAALAVTAYLPDGDFIFEVFLKALDAPPWAIHAIHHRGVTHGIIGALLLARIAGWIASLWAYTPEAKRSLARMFLGVGASHVVLDTLEKTSVIPLLAPLWWDRFALTQIQVIPGVGSSLVLTGQIVWHLDLVLQELLVGGPIAAIWVAMFYRLACKLQPALK